MPAFKSRHFITSKHSYMPQRLTDSSMKTLSSEAIHWLSAGFLAYISSLRCTFSRFTRNGISTASLHVYSDRIAQDFHLILFYPDIPVWHWNSFYFDLSYYIKFFWIYNSYNSLPEIQNALRKMDSTDNINVEIPTNDFLRSRCRNTVFRWSASLPCRMLHYPYCQNSGTHVPWLRCFPAKKTYLFP